LQSIVVPKRLALPCLGTHPAGDQLRSWAPGGRMIALCGAAGRLMHSEATGGAWPDSG